MLRNSRVTSDILALVDDRTLVRYLHEHRHARRIPRKIPELPDRPAYSPDFNPIEWIWQHLKSHYLAGYLTKSGHELGNKVYDSIRSLLDQPESIRSICRTHSE